MSQTNIEVGSYEAKTKLPELLRGKAVADLVPVQGHKRSGAATAAENMRAFMRSRQPVAGVDLKALIDEGRA
ncbi:MAG: prevent-host-death protein [Betaproteobacteria bacterium]|nr:prevent-host-death protein [Betaproteobacteria bacterium]